jgi:hypothetical protein
MAKLKLSIPEWAAHYGFTIHPKALDHLLKHRTEWRVTANDRLRRRLGVTWWGGPKANMIEIAGPLIAAPDEHRDTFLHEVAHVLCGPHAEHGLFWRQTAIMLGANPAPGNMSPAMGRVSRWQAWCVEHGVRAGTTKRPAPWELPMIRCDVCNRPMLVVRKGEGERAVAAAKRNLLDTVSDTVQTA